MASMKEVEEKEKKVRQMLDNESLDAAVLLTNANISWFTCGGNAYVGLATDLAVIAIVVTRDKKVIICDNIEASRIENEEIVNQGFDFFVANWCDFNRNKLIKDIAGNGAIGCDSDLVGSVNIASAMDELRMSLTEEELDRYREVGRLTGEAIANAAKQVHRGMTEHQIAGILAGEVFTRGMTPTVCLVAADERISRYRHPLPTGNMVSKIAMLVIGARKGGLIVSATRLVAFDGISKELRRRHDAVVKVDTAFICESRPGALYSEIFKAAQGVYADEGFADEWKLHHQGGPTGYKGREFRANLSTRKRVVKNTAIAWNPSITGTKSEDTILCV